jgi:lipoprotein-anchoring transpeptidase ErfK/SrfK
MRRIVETSKRTGIVAMLFLAGGVYGQEPSPPTTLTQPTRQVVVSIPDRRLVLLEDGRTLKVYQVAVGAAESPSPEGDFSVINRLENPTYYKPGIVIEPGEDNPLGTRWIGLNLKGYGIHGTNVPNSIGKAASHGCNRMRQADLEELFTMIRTGDRVSIRDERGPEMARIMRAEPVAVVGADENGSDSDAATSGAQVWAGN